MGGLLGGSGGGGSQPQQTTTTVQNQQVNIPEWAVGPLKKSLTRAEELFDQPYQNLIQDLSPDELAAFDLVRQNAGAYQPYLDQAAQQSSSILGRVIGGPSTQDIQSRMNPYLDQVLDSRTFLAEQEYDRRMQDVQDLAQGAGAYGGSRLAVAERELGQDYARNLSDIQAQEMYQAYNNALGQFNLENELGMRGAENLAGVAGAGQAGIGSAASMLQLAGQQQRQIDQGRAEAEFNYPYQQVSFLQNAALGPASLYSSNITGTSTGTATAQSGSGSTFGNIVGTGLSIAGALGGFFNEGGMVPGNGYACGGMVKDSNKYAGGGFIEMLSGVGSFIDNLFGGPSISNLSDMTGGVINLVDPKKKGMNPYDIYENDFAKDQGITFFDKLKDRLGDKDFQLAAAKLFTDDEDEVPLPSISFPALRSAGNATSKLDGTPFSQKLFNQGSLFGTRFKDGGIIPDTDMSLLNYMLESAHEKRRKMRQLADMPKDEKLDVASTDGVQKDYIAALEALFSKQAEEDYAIPEKEIRALKDFIGDLESKGDYNATHNSVQGDYNLTDMTLKEIYDLQDKIIMEGGPSSAMGKYQIMRTTLQEMADKAGLTGDELFDEALQDRIADMLLERRGYSDFLAGDLSEKDFMRNLAQEFAGMPLYSSGKSYHESDLNKALTDPATVIEVLRKERGYKNGGLIDAIFGPSVTQGDGTDSMAHLLDLMNSLQDSGPKDQAGNISKVVEQKNKRNLTEVVLDALAGKKKSDVAETLLSGALGLEKMAEEPLLDPYGKGSYLERGITTAGEFLPRLLAKGAVKGSRGIEDVADLLLTDPDEFNADKLKERHAKEAEIIARALKDKKGTTKDGKTEVETLKPSREEQRKQQAEQTTSKEKEEERSLWNELSLPLLLAGVSMLRSDGDVWQDIGAGFEGFATGIQANAESERTKQTDELAKQKLMLDLLKTQAETRKLNAESRGLETGGQNIGQQYDDFINLYKEELANATTSDPENAAEIAFSKAVKRYPEILAYLKGGADPALFSQTVNEATAADQEYEQLRKARMKN